MRQKKGYLILITIISFAIIGFLLVINFTVFADSGSGKFKVYKLSQFPNLYDENKKITYKDIDLGNKEEISELKLKIPRGETEGFTLLLENSTIQSIANLTINKEDFANENGSTLSSQLIDEKVIHVWPTKQFNWQNKGVIWPEDRDEILVKSDKVDFLSEDISTTVDTQLQSHQSAIDTTIESLGSKKFYFKVTAPADQSGNYSSQVNFFDQDEDKILAKIKINLEILDLDIMRPSQAKEPYVMGCFNNDRIELGNSKDLITGDRFISEELFRSRMKIAKDYGCESMVHRIGPYADNIKALEVYSELGYKGPIVLNYYYFKKRDDGSKVVDYLDTLSTQASKNEFRKIIREIKNNEKITVPVVFYGIDEPNTESDQVLHLEKTKNIDLIISEELGGEIDKSNIKSAYGAAMSSDTVQKFDQMGKKTDIPIIAFFTWQKFLSLIGNGTIGSYPEKVFYYQGFMEYPLSNRYINGFGLANSGMKGSFSNPLYGYISTDTKPLYDDFSTHDNKFGYKTWKKPMMTFYPASDGFFSTYQAEGRREGINDLRYYLTYKEHKTNKNGCKNSARLTALENSIDRKFKNSK